MDYQEQNEQKRADIRKAVCLKASVDLVAGLSRKEREAIKTNGLTGVVIAIAKEFETYLKED